MGIGEPFRIQPQGPVTGYRSFGMTVTRRVQATCEEFGCQAFREGWLTTVLPDSEDAMVLLAACRGEVDGRRRGYTLLALPDGFVRFNFEPGQPCFKASTHSVPWDARLYHRNGDWRGNPDGPGAVTVHSSAESWVAEFGEHQQRIIEQRQRYGAE